MQVQQRQLRRNVHAKVTDDAQGYGPSIQAIDPAAAVEAALDQALMEDARRHHYRSLIADWEAFGAGWSDHARKCENWAVAMAARILNDSQLPAHSLPRGEPYVMHFSLAIFLYLRLFGRPSPTLQKMKEGEAWVLSGLGPVASGSEAQIDHLVSVLDSLIEAERGKVQALLEQSRSLQEGLRALSQKLSSASSERSLRGRCSMVRFFR